MQNLKIAMGTLWNTMNETTISSNCKSNFHMRVFLHKYWKWFSGYYYKTVTQTGNGQYIYYSVENKYMLNHMSGEGWANGQTPPQKKKWPFLGGVRFFKIIFLVMVGLKNGSGGVGTYVEDMFW